MSIGEEYSRTDLDAQVAAVEVSAPPLGGGKEREEVGQQVAHEGDQ